MAARRARQLHLGQHRRVKTDTHEKPGSHKRAGAIYWRRSKAAISVSRTMILLRRSPAIVAYNAEFEQFRTPGQIPGRSSRPDMARDMPPGSSFSCASRCHNGNRWMAQDW
jgi:hypothetical protein